MQRLKQNSGSSTQAGYSDNFNDSLAKNSGNFFTSPSNNMNELTDSGVGKNPSSMD